MVKKAKSKSKKNVLAKLVANKGFYIALFSLIAVVGFYVYAQNLQTSVKNDVVSFDENAWQEAVAESGIEVINVDDIKEDKTQPIPKTQIPPQTQQKNDGAAIETTAEAEPLLQVAKPTTLSSIIRMKTFQDLSAIAIAPARASTSLRLCSNSVTSLQ